MRRNMKIFLDTTHSEDIEKWSYLLDGITTNPSHLAKEQKNPTQQILKICSLMKGKDVSVEVTEKSPQRVYEQAKKISRLAPNVVVKIPCFIAYYPLIKKLVEENVPLNITLLFSLNQGLFMCKLGVRYISPFVGRIDDNDGDGIELLYRLREMIDRYGYQTQILAASLRSVRHLHEAIVAGADIATIPTELLKKASEHILTDKGIELFDTDWKKLGTPHFPEA